ncbi:redox-sensitive transcriptional activator SoxR [Epidermidibacterium keratini]|uniref:Redox-sensitive transcriptional activator SoxR n=1 Tax=Epidermidibacterium keratini TaxID=1891644 RepID=A0A7L4YNI7_9ACTN|nr:redox-sensitive transcriptional activator SoxR [Epidermidibacterium keratini]QHC00720.1 redox-sensitive transcriptional activator SoxR [Epidermidibacterium keratini]
MNPEDSLSIGEISRRTGVAPSALHYYESLGLISSSRTSGNQRRYSRHMVRRISLIVVAKRIGVPLADVERAFEPLPHDAQPSSRDWHRVASLWRETLRERRAQLERLEHELTGCIGCGCLSMKSCRLLNPDDTLAEQGPGPHRL